MRKMMAFRLFNWVLFIVEREGASDIHYERRWPPLCELPKVGEYIEVSRLKTTGKVTKVIRSGSRLLKVYITPLEEVSE